MKINNFQVDLSDVSGKKEPLVSLLNIRTKTIFNSVIKQDAACVYLKQGCEREHKGEALVPPPLDLESDIVWRRHMALSTASVRVLRGHTVLFHNWIQLADHQVA